MEPTTNPTTQAIVAAPPAPQLHPIANSPTTASDMDELKAMMRNLTVTCTQTHATVHTLQQTMLEHTQQLADHARQLREQADLITALQKELKDIQAAPKQPAIQEEADDTNWPRVSSTSRWSRRSLPTPPGLPQTDPTQHHTTEGLPFADADAIIISGFPDKTPKEERIKAANEIFSELKRSAPNFQRPIYARQLYSSVIHIKKLPHLSRNALAEAAAEFKEIQPPPTYTDSNKQDHELFLTPCRDPVRSARNKALRALLAHLKVKHETAEICWSGHIYVNCEKVIKVYTASDVTILKEGFLKIDEAKQIIAEALPPWARPQRG